MTKPVSSELYDRLHVDSSATKNDIKKAYRKRAKESHPDLYPGKEEEFRGVSEAYAILCDDKKRKEYDSTGTVEDKQKKAKVEYELIKDRLQTLFRNELSPDMLKHPIVENMLKAATNSLTQEEMQRQKGIELLKKIRKVKTGLKVKKGKIRSSRKNCFVEMLDEQIVQVQAAVRTLISSIKVWKIVISILECYDWKKEASDDFVEPFHTGINELLKHFNMRIVTDRER